MANWEMVVGLETHVELMTRSKMFCGCANRYGAEPNSCVCPICMGLPGTLPIVNGQAVRLGVIAGFALHCEVHSYSRFDRKNYFYPDLPKGYQITQFYHPLCEHGFLDIQVNHRSQRIGITRIHLEEDAGKLKHDGQRSLLDLNRCGVPLIEIVTEPDFHSAREASAYLRELQSVLSFAGVSMCRMNEGSLRCDVNISVHPYGEPFGERCEIKNLNSFQSVEKTIEYEYSRQKTLLEQGERIVRETRRFDEKTGKTVLMREKEDSADYRYFPEPDLPPLILTENDLWIIRDEMPSLPQDYRHIMICDYALSEDTALQLCRESWLAAFFLETAEMCHQAETMAQLIVGEGFRLLGLRDGKHNGELSRDDWCVTPKKMADLSNLLSDGIINNTTAKMLLARMLEGEADPVQITEVEGLAMIRDEETIGEIVQKVLEENDKLIYAWMSGKLSVEKALMGKCMSKSNGKLYAPAAERILHEALEQRKNNP